MQRKKQTDSPEPSFTLPELSGTNETALLHLALGYYAVQHPNEKPHAAISRSIGVSEGTFIQALAGTTHIGLDAWCVIEVLIGIPLAHIYMEKKGQP